ncbi:MAG TPA: lytic transglycosylase domain-containing protein [Egibacteraceae bacterium]|nr:lytic transglycosylase domain-containing protein [Egibacteraceae bacterium]
MSRLLIAFGLAVALAVPACTTEGPDAGAPATEAQREAAPPADAPAEPSPAPPEAPPQTPPEVAPEAPPEPVAPQGPPALAEDPVGLAQQIVAAEQAIRSDHASPQELADAGHVQQAAYRRLAATPGWRDAVLGAVPAELHGIVAAHVDAQTGLSALTTPQSQLPVWRILPPPPAEELLGHYREAEAAFGVGWEYLAAIHLVETRMGRIRGTSPAGAQGPMQFMPGTWAAYGEGDVNDPRDAILAAGRYLSANGAPGNMDNALFRYNRSNAYVRAITTYAEQMRADPRTYRGYYHWQVYYRTTEGDRLLPEGYDGSR